MPKKRRGDFSKQLESVWAKSSRDDSGDHYAKLVDHAADTHGVASHLIDNFFPKSVFEAWKRGLSKEVSDLEAANFISTIAAIHDVGKISPEFSSYWLPGAKKMEESGLDGASEQLWGSMTEKRFHHTLTGAEAIMNLRRSVKGGPLLNAIENESDDGLLSIASVVAAHHGVWHGEDKINPLLRAPEKPSKAWRNAQQEFLEYFVTTGGCEDIFGQVSMNLVGQMIAAGVTMTADWISSDESLFPYAESSPERTAKAMRKLSLPPRIEVSMPPDPDAHLKNILGAEEEVVARPVQRKMSELVKRATCGELYIVEAATGEGKTECAFMAAEIMMANKLAGGIAFALPTQSTTDGMLPRVIAFSESIPGLQDGVDFNLSHGKKKFNHLFQELVEAGRVRDYDADSCEAHQQYIHVWMSRKKQLLSTFYVSTVDAIAMSALNLKHNSFRHLGLSGKVVIIDEVHAYDSFLRAHLCKVMSWLGAYGVPVILMSATLPADIKEEFVRAYNPFLGNNESLREGEIKWAKEYPLITVTKSPDPPGLQPASKTSETAKEESFRQHTVEGTSRSKKVKIECVEASTPENIKELIGTGGGEGCILVIRNTVKSAIDTAEAMIKEFGRDCVTLHHSRYVAHDRSAKDLELLKKFGSPSYLKSNGGKRPRRHIVVATQVVEQSLDLDFDLLITDLCPADLLLQRIGRLHRHDRKRPIPYAAPKAYVITPSEISLDESPKIDFGSKMVYGKWVLLRTAAAIMKRGREINIPEDVRGLVEDTYNTQINIAPESWKAELEESLRERIATMESHRSLAKTMQIPSPYCDMSSSPWRGGYSDYDENSPIVQGSVRLGGPSAEVIIVKETLEGRLAPVYGGSKEMLDPTKSLTWDTARILSGSSVRVPLYVLDRSDSGKGNTSAIDRFIGYASEKTPALWRDDPKINSMPVIVLNKGKCYLNDIIIEYTRDNGLTIRKERR